MNKIHADLGATIQKEIASSDALSAKIEDLSVDIAEGEAEIKKATGIVL